MVGGSSRRTAGEGAACSDTLSCCGVDMGRGGADTGGCTSFAACLSEKTWSKEQPLVLQQNIFSKFYLVKL